MVGGTDSPRPALHLWRSLLVAVALGLALPLVGIAPASAQQLDGEMAVDCEGNSLELEAECQFGEGQEFTVAIQVVSPPEEGYAAFQVKLRWDAGILEYRPAERPALEAVWPECTVPVRNDSLTADPPGTTVLFGCVPFPVTDPPELFTDTGTVLLLTFVCAGQGTSDIVLVPREGGSLLATYFFLSTFVSGQIDPSLAAASVTCGGAEIARPEPEVTPGAEALSPEGTIVPPEEQVPAAEAAETIRASPDYGMPEGEGAGGDDGDGVGAWLWVLIGVVGIAVVGGLAVGWSRRRQEP